MPNELTFKQQLFIEHYLETGNATKSAILAGYSAKTARQIGSELLHKPIVAESIETRFGSAIKTKKQRQPDNIYFVRVEGENAVKIGCSRHIEGRLAHLKAATYKPLVLLHSFRADNAKEVEKRLHEHYAQYALLHEWFLLPDKEIEMISRGLLSFR